MPLDVNTLPEVPDDISAMLIDFDDEFPTTRTPLFAVNARVSEPDDANINVEFALILANEFTDPIDVITLEAFL